MNHFTESACNRCDRRCRAGVYLGHKHAVTVCPTGGAPDFAVTEYVRGVRPSFELADPVTEIPAGVTMLLGCETCGKSCPCLLEITGPADRLPCVLRIEDRPVWRRVTS